MLRVPACALTPTEYPSIACALTVGIAGGSMHSRRACAPDGKPVDYLVPALFLASKYGPTWLVAGLGVVYLIGRLMYWRAYVSDPMKRGTGFMLSILPTGFLAILALVGIVLSLTGLRA